MVAMPPAVQSLKEARSSSSLSWNGVPEGGSSSGSGGPASGSTDRSMRIWFRIVCQVVPGFCSMTRE